MMKINTRQAAPRLLPCLLSMLLLLTACGEQRAPVQPLAIAEGSVCSLDGMVLQDFPGPKAQIHYDRGEPDFFCDTKEMFSIFLRPEQKKRIVAIYTQDMGKTDWTRPEGHWLDARTAFYVLGSSRRGSMGPTVASFGSEADASKFAGQYGGQVRRFDQITMDMVDLSGGTSHDEKM